MSARCESPAKRRKMALKRICGFVKISKKSKKKEAIIDLLIFIVLTYYYAPIVVMSAEKSP